MQLASQLQGRRPFSLRRRACLSAPMRRGAVFIIVGVVRQGFDGNVAPTTCPAISRTKSNRGTAIKVIATEVLIHRPVLEHVVDGRKDGAGDGHDGFVGAAPGFDAGSSASVPTATSSV